jgi:8-oxo-dGTP diphosphatase
MSKFNPHISVDCVVFGFGSGKLKVLLVERELLGNEDPAVYSGKFKLPGSLISDTEELETEAYRVLKDLTGLEKVFLRQFAVFGRPLRLSNPNDLEWLRQTYGMPIERVVTIAYYSLIKIDDENLPGALLENSCWVDIDKIPQLVFDHNHIVNEALAALRKELRTEPIGFELLPKKFSLRQLQTLYEVVFGMELDNRNFRKKLGKLEYLIPLPEKQKGVSHKPAQLYKFDKKLFLKLRKDSGFYI